MKILFMDDDPSRCSYFRSKHPTATIVHTSKDCIEKLKSESWDEVHLDHDLGGEVYVDSAREDCGMEVVRWVVSAREGLPETDTSFVVHTMNTTGGKEMVRSLLGAGFPARYWPWHRLFR